MRNLSNIGRIFYGIVIAETGFHTIYYRDFPYLLIPPNHSWLPGFVPVAYISGVLFILAGTCIVFKIKPRTVSLQLGGVLLLIFCFYFIPYGLMNISNFTHLVDWENSEKEVALAGGAFVIAGCFSEQKENPLNRLLGKLIPFGDIMFAIPIISFGILHFLYAEDVATMIPTWIPNHLFWSYFAGAALLGSGIAIILKIKTGLIAALLGTMTLLWFIVLHIPRVIDAPTVYIGSEVTSALLALAYSGTAFVIAGRTRKI